VLAQSPRQAAAAGRRRFGYVPLDLARIVTVLIAALAHAACLGSRSGPPPGSEANPNVHVTLTRDRAGPLIEVTGLAASDVRTIAERRLTGEEWSALLSVTVTDEVDQSDSLPSIIGSYAVATGRIRFRPKYPFDPGRRYRVLFDPARFSRFVEPAANSRAPRIEAIITVPAVGRLPTSRVVATYPTASVVPENQLRLYIYFSAPMGFAGGVTHIRLLDESGRAVKDPFLPMDVALWNGDRTRYTVLFDPGRVKRGILPHEQLGRPLQRHRKYTLIVDRDWTDAQGLPLIDEYRREFRAGDPIDQPLDPSKWRVEPPSEGTREPLVVSFPTPLDYGLMQRALAVWRADGEAIEGEVFIDAEETRWRLVPRSPWRAGEYRFVSDTTLEDPAGNRIGRPFELKVSSGHPHDVRELEATVPFRIVPRP
jgi:hypothetical protein